MSQAFKASFSVLACLLWAVLCLVLPVTFGHATVCRSLALTFSAAIRCASIIRVSYDGPDENMEEGIDENVEENTDENMEEDTDEDVEEDTDENIAMFKLVPHKRIEALVRNSDRCNGKSL